MGIDLELWRARIGAWHARCHCLKRRGGKRARGCQLQPYVMGLTGGMAFHSPYGGANKLFAVFVAMLLLLAGDIELNPGPGMGEHYLN